MSPVPFCFIRVPLFLLLFMETLGNPCLVDPHWVRVRVYPIRVSPTLGTMCTNGVITSGLTLGHCVPCV